MASKAELHEMLMEREWRKCAPDWDESTVDEKVEAFAHFARKYLYIRFPGKGKIPFELRPAQLATVRDWIEHPQTVALKARQVGFSTLISLFSLWLCFFWGDRTIIMVSKAEREAKQLLKHARYALKYMPKWMLARGPKFSQNQEQIEFTNESIMLSAPSASDPARGMTAFIIVVDEFGQLPDDQEAWASIEPVASVGGRIIMLGTANGEGNLFHETFVNAHGEWIDQDGEVHEEGAGNNNFHSIFHGWWSGFYTKDQTNPETGKNEKVIAARDDEWYERQKRAYFTKPHLLAQEYPRSPEEAFRVSGRPVFDFDVLNGLERERPLYGTLSPDLEFFEGEGGPLRLYRPPVEGHKYAMGVDIAEGLEHGDFSSVHVIDVTEGEVAAHWHGHIDPDQLATDVVIHLGNWYHQALALVEINNMGLVTITALKREQYFPIYRQRRHQSRDNKSPSEQLGWRTTVATKPLAIGELAAHLRDGDLQVYDLETIAELRTYRRDEKGRMEGSPHDDRVMSLAIAAQGFKYVHAKEYQPKNQEKPGTVKWYRDQAMKGVAEAQPMQFMGQFSVQ